MMDYQRIVDDLRGFVAGNLDGDGLDSVLAEYQDACRQANDRLRRCDSLIKSGLRGEAIQLCEIEPNLLDVAVTLDFPDRVEVQRALQLRGKSLPPLLTDAAAELNEAYAAHQPVEALLGKHRLLALAGAPLKDRLAVLRKIGEADPANPIWNDDLALYEQERFKEMHTEAARAARKKEKDVLESIYVEVTAGPWRTMPPDFLVPSLERAITGLRKSSAQEELQGLKPKLCAAFQAQDLATARQLRDKWNAAADLCQLPPDNAVSAEVAPILSWVESDDRRMAREQEIKTVLSQLSQLLTQPFVTKSDVDRAGQVYGQAKALSPSASANLEARFRQRVDQWRSVQRRRKAGLISSAIVLAILVGAAGFWGIQRNIHAREVTEAVATLTALYAEIKADPNRISATEKSVAELQASSPAVCAEVDVRRLIDQIAFESKIERERAAKFQHNLERAAETGPDTPDRISLKRAAELARTEAEKTAVTLFESKIAAAERYRQKTIDDEFTAQIAVVSKKLDELATRRPAEFVDFNDEMDRLVVSVADLEEKKGQVSESVEVMFSPLKAQLGSLRTVFERAEHINRAQKAVVANSGDVQKFADSMKEFVETYPDAESTPHFTKVLSESTHWKLIDDWNRKVQAACEEKDPSAAAKLMTDTSQTFATFPGASSLSDRATHLASLAARRDESGASALSQLKILFENRLLRRSWVLRAKPDYRFYLQEKAVLSTADSQTVRHVIDLNTLAERDAVVPLANIVDIVEAPHCNMVREITNTLNQMTSDALTWEAGFASLINGVLSARDVEPLLRLSLLKRFVELGCRGSTAMRQSLKLEAGILSNTDADLLANWLDSRNRDTQRATLFAEKELSRLATVADNSKAAVGLARELEVKLSDVAVYKPIGCLLPSTKMIWECRLGKDSILPANGDLYTLVLDDDLKPQLRPVGKIVEGKPALELRDSLHSVAGRPIWFAQPFTVEP